VKKEEKKKKKKNIGFDVCCGTGTIGIVVANKFDNVVGIDIVPAAIADAKSSAARNGLKNIEFVVGKAEVVLEQQLKSITDEECVAIVDPPRAGLHPKTIKAIRQCEQLTKLVYVSCKQTSLINDAANLCRSASNTMIGAPFKPQKAVAVDLFPHTEQCELIVLFTRVK